jgi:predicted NBD/HSP70 family sugar kinase
MTQAEIARSTGLSAATVSNIVRGLAEVGVFDVGPTSSTGRRGRIVRLSRSRGVALGIDFGHSHLRVAVGDAGDHILAEEVVPLEVDASATDGCDLATRLLERLLDGAGVARSEVVGAGIGIPGPIDAATGAVGSSVIVPGWDGIRPAEEMGRRLGVPVLVDNDANLGALGESLYGAARGRGDAAYIKVATGVGAGLIIGGQIYRGEGGTAGEIGHVTIDEQGPVCRCGNRGCLETFAGAPFLLELLRHSHGGDLTFARLIELAAHGDAGCCRVIADAGRYIGVAVANLCNLLNPGMVVVGGDLAGLGDLLLGPIRATVGRQAIPSATRRVEIVNGTLGARAEILGALVVAFSAATPLLVAGLPETSPVNSKVATR